MEAPDVETASDKYARRFSGPVGRWFLDVQEEATLRMLAPYAGGKVLDVGGGHGQTADSLVQEGFELTVLGSSEVCKTQIADLVSSGDCEFKVGDLLSLPFEDDSFDVVMSYRMLPHVDSWKLFLAELARVAKEAVVIDYPEVRSFNYIKPLLFSVKKKVEGDTRPYRCFRMEDVLSVFNRDEMVYSDHYRQFFWPMVLHRKMDVVQISIVAERIGRMFGLTEALGSPVILKVTNSIDRGR